MKKRAVGGPSAYAHVPISREEEQERNKQELEQKINDAKSQLTSVFENTRLQAEVKTRTINDLSRKMNELIDLYDRESGEGSWFDFDVNEQRALDAMTEVGTSLKGEIDQVRGRNTGIIDNFRRVNPKFLKLWDNAKIQTSAYHQCLEAASKKFGDLTDKEKEDFKILISEPLRDAIALVTFEDAMAMRTKDPGVEIDALAKRYVRCSFHSGNSVNACSALYPVISMFNTENRDHNEQREAASEVCVAYVKLKIKELDSIMAAAEIIVETFNATDLGFIAKTLVKLLFLNASVEALGSMMPSIECLRVLSNDAFRTIRHISPFALMPYASRECVNNIGNKIGTLMQKIVGWKPLQDEAAGGGQPVPVPPRDALVTDLLDGLLSARKLRARAKAMGSEFPSMPQSPFDFAAYLKSIQYLLRWTGVGLISATQDGMENINSMFTNVSSFLKTQFRSAPEKLRDALWDTAIERATTRNAISSVDDLFFADLKSLLDSSKPVCVKLIPIVGRLDRKTLSEANVQIFQALQMQEHPTDMHRHVSPSEDSSMRGSGTPSSESQEQMASIINNADGLIEPPQTSDEMRTVYVTGAGHEFYALTPPPPPNVPSGWGPFDWDATHAKSAADAAAAGRVPARSTRSKKQTEEDQKTGKQQLAIYAAQFGKPHQDGGKAHTYKRSTSKHTKHKKSSGLKQKSKKNKRQSRRKLRRASSRKGRK